MSVRHRAPARIRRRLAIAVSAAAAMLPVTLATGAARAGLTPGTGWTAVSLPAQYVIENPKTGQVMNPVNCVSGADFCMAIAFDSNIVLPPNDETGQADLVSTDGGQTWTAYTDMPKSMLVSSLSCVTTSVCWAAGAGWNDQPTIAETTDGGQTWTDMTPSSWADAIATWWPNSIDCVSTTSCWLAGQTGNSVQSPAIAEFTGSGASWTTYSNDPTATWATESNLPTFTPYDPNGTYILNGISCVSALDCVAVGGMNESDGVAQVISTTDGGATWSLSADPTLSGLQQLFSVDCLPVSGALPVCAAAADATQAGGPAEITSADGGTTWSGMQTYDKTGWLGSISCADIEHCWAAGRATTVALVGTGDGGSSWSAETSDTAGEYGYVSCATVNFCIATTDGALWVTTDDGGLSPATSSATHSLAGATTGQVQVGHPVTLSLPKVSGARVSARIGRAATVIGQYHRLPGSGSAATSVSAAVRRPDGARFVERLSIGRNNYYSMRLARVQAGTTTVTFTAMGATKVTVRITGYKDAAPQVSGLSAHAGPVSGGNTLTITGTGFSHVAAVYFGTKPGADVTVRSATRLTVRAPAGRVLARYVSVITAGGGPSPLTGRSLYNYLPAPTISHISPRSGHAAGGTTVTIIGTDLAYVRAVFFGTRRATHLVVVSPRMITIVAPAGNGTVDVRVRTAGGTSKVVAADRFRY